MIGRKIELKYGPEPKDASKEKIAEFCGATAGFIAYLLGARDGLLFGILFGVFVVVRLALV